MLRRMPKLDWVPLVDQALGAFDRALDKVRKTRLKVIEGMVPGLKDLPAGCRFQNRCPYRIAACDTQPALESVGPGHETACHRWRELPPR